MVFQSLGFTELYFYNMPVVDPYVRAARGKFVLAFKYT